MKIRIFQILAALFIAACANPQPPSGGPQDKTPPVITEFFPEQGTVDYNDNQINIKFNKYMDKNKVIENIFMSPSAKMTYAWSGKELEVNFDEPLDSNTTYVFSIGTEYTDLKQNKPAEAFSLIFSTGNYLDSGAIQGTLYDKDPSGAYIYAYKIDGINPDTLDPSHTKPNYRTQTGSSGNFKLLALKKGTYRIISIRDVFKDEIYNEGSDDFGSAPYDVNVEDDSIPIVNLKIGKPIDKTGPMLFYAEAIFSNLISLNFSEPIDSSGISAKAFSIKDSTGTKLIKVLGTMIHPESNDKILLVPAEPLDSGLLWTASVSDDDIFTIRDTAYNAVQDTANKITFYSVAEKDTANITFAKITLKDSTKNVDINPMLYFMFSRPVDKLNFSERVNLKQVQLDNQSDKNENIPLNISWKSDNIFSINPLKLLNSLKWYSLTIRLDSLKYFYGSSFPDSTLIINFQTKDTRNYGGAKGIVKNLNYSDSSLKIIFYNDKETYLATPADSGKWNIPLLPDGKYKVEMYYDLDNNGKYGFGEAYPFKHSEPFLFLEKEQEIPARWIIELTLPALEK